MYLIFHPQGVNALASPGNGNNIAWPITFNTVLSARITAVDNGSDIYRLSLAGYNKFGFSTNLRGVSSDVSYSVISVGN